MDALGLLLLACCLLAGAGLVLAWCSYLLAGTLSLDSLASKRFQQISACTHNALPCNALPVPTLRQVPNIREIIEVPEIPKILEIPRVSEIPEVLEIL